MSESSPTVLVLGRTELLASVAAAHLETNSSAAVVNCGSDVSAAVRKVTTTPVDAVVVFSNGDDGPFADELGALVEEASTASCPVVVNGVSDDRTRGFAERGRGVLRTLTREDPLERLWEELERSADVDREEGRKV